MKKFSIFILAMIIALSFVTGTVFAEELITDEVYTAENATASEEVTGEEPETEEPETEEPETEEPEQEKLLQPSITEVYSGEGNYKICWEKVENASCYVVYRKINKSDRWTKLKKTNNAYYTDKKTEAGINYYYAVEADNDEAKSEVSEAVSTKYVPKTPAVKKTSSGVKLIQITWGKVKNAEGYMLYKKKANASYKAVTSTKKISYKDKKISTGTFYNYKVKSYKKVNGVVYWSNGSNVTKGMCLAVPKLKKIKSEDDKITIKWSSVKNAKKYYVYRKYLKGKWKKVAELKNNQYIDTTMSKVGRYTYTVRAIYKSSKLTVIGQYNKNGVSTNFKNEAITLANKQLNKIGRNLKKAYNWASSVNWVWSMPGNNKKEFAINTFKNKTGDCVGMAAAFVYMARALGYEAHVVDGYIAGVSANSVHSWSEIYYKGKWRVCDPYFQKYKGNAWMIYYGQPGTWKYTSYHWGN